MAAGRPSKYNKKYCQELIEHCATGLSIRAFAGKIGVNTDTIAEWANKYPEFTEAKKRAQLATCHFWEQHYRNATIKDKRLKDKDHYAYNTVLLIFAMKNMCGWSDRVDNQTTLEPRGTFKLAYNLDD